MTLVGGLLLSELPSTSPLVSEVGGLGCDAGTVVPKPPFVCPREPPLLLERLHPSLSEYLRPAGLDVGKLVGPEKLEFRLLLAAPTPDGLLRSMSELVAAQAISPERSRD